MSQRSFSIRDNNTLSNYFPAGIINVYSKGGGGGGGGGEGGTMDNPAEEDLDMNNLDIFNVNTISSYAGNELMLNSSSGGLYIC